ncbi:hypothetical protein [Treponema sp.]|uniref:hypothetical protein n=1 Tax=Treponema sp. TaxID=166 RepID=UPI003FA1E827
MRIIDYMYVVYAHGKAGADKRTVCPQTIFHGTDVGHQYGTTGERFLCYLESKQQQNIPAYLRAQEIIQQGIAYYSGGNAKAMAYRENMIV